jgi:hypothetical protein
MSWGERSCLYFYRPNSKICEPIEAICRADTCSMYTWNRKTNPDYPMYYTKKKKK